MKKIRKNTARRVYKNGGSLIITPCRCHPCLFMGFEISKNSLDGRDFDSVINEFEYYNCTSETGRYTAFYVEEVEG